MKNGRSKRPFVPVQALSLGSARRRWQSGSLIFWALLPRAVLLLTRLRAALAGLVLLPLALAALVLLAHAAALDGLILLALVALALVLLPLALPLLALLAHLALLVLLALIAVLSGSPFKVLNEPWTRLCP